MNDFQTLPAGKWQQTLVVQKSRFVTFAARVCSATEAQTFIKSVALPDATHHCYAYVTADGQKSNDNGEPAGTAGLPILQAIKNAELFNIVVVVERYFGGIKLGTGGLTRAYAQATKQVLSAVKPIWVRDCVLLAFSSTYEQQSVITKLIQKFQGQNQIDYQANLQWQVSIPTAQKSTFAVELSAIMRTQPDIKILQEHSWVEFPA